MVDAEQGLLTPVFEPLRDDDDVYSITNFQEAVRQGAFTDYDEVGVLAGKNGKSGIRISPSRTQTFTGYKVVWYNK